jgi:hypothetical protein
LEDGRKRRVAVAAARRITGVDLGRARVLGTRHPASSMTRGDGRRSLFSSLLPI